MSKKYSGGEKHTATIDRISQAGNGIISAPSGHINLGPMDEARVGERVTFICHQGRYRLVSTNPFESDELENKNDLLGGHL